MAVKSPPNLNGSGWILEYKWGVTVCTHTKNSHKKQRKSSQGSTYVCQNMFLFFVTNTMWTLGHLSCTNFEYFWNKRRESVCVCVKCWKISYFLQRGLQVPKTTENGYFQGEFCDRVQLKWHNFGQLESFRGLANIPRMCLLWASFGGGGCIDWVL